MEGACHVEWRDETVVLMTVGDAVAVLRFVFRIRAIAVVVFPLPFPLLCLPAQQHSLKKAI
jgi:hypothetical protein